ncbi:MAG TPA: amidohydrolase family protein [Dehalococcoidia bacterium]|nr:amidohydrolase family protein [Dehalococcoidia bacterium]
MILDAHTHLFPPEIASHRDAYLAADPTFAELYASPEAKLATAEDLLRSMDEAQIDTSIALGFAWTGPDTCRLHTDYLLAAAAASNGRILAFPTLPLAAGPAAIEAEARRCAAAGSRGFGELRPDNLGFHLTGPAGDHLASLAAELDTVLLFHVTEPAGHAYPGKQGGNLPDFAAFVAAHPEVKIVGAHWAGGLPFYATMPRAAATLANLHVDTAATSLLYDDTIYTRVTELTGPESVLFGSDYPLLSQSRSRQRIADSNLDPAAIALILGANAATLLNL